MKKALIFIACLSLLSLLLPPADAQSPKPPIMPKQEFYKGKITHIIEEGQKKVGNNYNLFQMVAVLILDGPDTGKTVSIEHGGVFTITVEQKLQKDDTVILSKTNTPGEANYRIVDMYRLPNLLYVLSGFFLLIIIIAGRKGLGSIIGMVISLIVIVAFIIPQIINGVNPLLVSLVGSLTIMIATIYLAHGYSQQTSIAILATGISLTVTILLSILLVQLMRLSGLGSEDIYTLQQGFSGKINFQGLLLGGIIIGTLGVLDDVTTTQTTTIFTIAEANSKYTVMELIRRGMHIGREHIASLVNTLVLAYAGASIGIFIFLIFGLKNSTQPLWVILNSEVIIEEIVRTVVGSTGLILAVPITTLLASFFARYSLKIK